MSSIPWCKKVENDQKLKSRGGSCLKLLKGVIGVELLVLVVWTASFLSCVRTIVFVYFSSRVTITRIIVTAFVDGSTAHLDSVVCVAPNVGRPFGQVSLVMDVP